MRDWGRAARVLMAVLLSASGLFAQTRGVVTVTADIRSSVLFSGSTPAGTNFAQGGEQSASVTIAASPGAKSFSTRAVIANNPSSPGYDLIARLTAPGNVTLDGIQLSTAEAVIASQALYGSLETHSVEVKGGAVAIILTCRPQ